MKEVLVLIGTRLDFIKVTQFKKEAEQVGVNLAVETF